VSDNLCEADRVIAASQSKAFVRGLLPFLDRSCVCVNKIYAAERAESKSFQLMVAKESGFKIPEPVVTNDPTVIWSFVDRNGQKKDLQNPLLRLFGRPQTTIT
jgi:hypothetical protein